MFALLKEIEPNLKPNSIGCNFEQAAHSAMKDIFPLVQIKGFFFHLAQNMQKHLASMGFHSLYNTDPHDSLVGKYPSRDFASSSMHDNCFLQLLRYRNISNSRHVFDFIYTVVQQGKVCEIIILCSSFP